MSYSDTRFKDIKTVCIEKYGQESGLNIYNKAEELFQKMKDKADYRNSNAIKEHMTKNIFPVLSYYMAMLENGFTTDVAYANTMEETQKHALLAKKSNKKLSKIPFCYYIFKMFCRKIMTKDFPIEGWETEWVRYDNKEIHFNLKRCVYHEITSLYCHPELCTVFCSNDTTSFSGYMPNIKFERSGTIAEGKDMCDFHFKNGKHI